MTAMVATACRSSGDTTTTTAAGEDPAAAIRASFAGSDQLTVQITYEGGMVGDWGDTLIPPFSLYADGRLLVRGNEPSVSAMRPVVRPVDAIQLVDEELLTVFGLIADMGLPGFEREFGTIPGRGTVVDAGSTVVSYFDVAGGVHRYSVHTLSVIGEQSVPEPILRMQELIDLLTRISDEPGRRVPMDADRIQLVLLEPPDLGGLNLPWPLEAAPEDFVEVDGIGPCHVLSGIAAPEAAEAFSAGGVRTTWEYEGVRWRLWGRHLLEGETGCEPS